MERRKAITTAAVASLTLLAGAGGIALSSGIVGASGDGPVGRLSPVSTVGPSTAIDAPAPSAGEPAAAPAGTPMVRPTDAPPVSASAASGHEVDDDHRREGDEVDDHDQDDRRDDREDHDDDHEVEGASDDD
jgi:hypothetical protein